MDSVLIVVNLVVTGLVAILAVILGVYMNSISSDIKELYKITQELSLFAAKQLEINSSREKESGDSERELSVLREKIYEINNRLEKLANEHSFYHKK